MTVAPAWVAPYVGLPYKDKGRGPDGWDCWGGVRMVLSEVFGLDVPSYDETYASGADRVAVPAAVESGLAEGWERTDTREPGSLLILRIAGRPWHCGLIVAPNLFLHWAPHTTSCMERLDSLMWTRRIEGIYRRRVLEKEGESCDTFP